MTDLGCRALQLAAALCAYHLRAGGCALEFTKDRRCVFADQGDGRSGVLCGYFERAVLPTDPELVALYGAARGEDVRPTARRLMCARCGKVFSPRNNRQRYCDGCRRIVARERARERKCRQRVSVGVPVTL